ncbi:solute carrier organic anion transporter family member 6A1-like [Cervus elaphus]|uniref:solute carrier organic anion transporter family member 6A1-like n=1 Tax=Cervus elaphus TaxID=9860 RepID=UPI001CC326C7|nr:solute carrier organic anion transporter family member 6A1-like [Cervus elaphus]
MNLYNCTPPYSSHQPHVATGRLKCDQYKLRCAPSVKYTLNTEDLVGIKEYRLRKAGPQVSGGVWAAFLPSSSQNPTKQEAAPDVLLEQLPTSPRDVCLRPKEKRSPWRLRLRAALVANRSPTSRPGRLVSSCVQPPPRLSAMQRGLVQVQPEVVQAPGQLQSQAEQAAPSESTGPLAVEAEKAGTRRPHLRIFPVSLLKLGAFSQQGGGQARATQHGSKTEVGHRKGSVEGPCGWGCLVFPWCQRFNNVRCFLIFFCILVTAQCVVFGLVDLSTESFKQENYLNIVENVFLSLTYDISSCLVVVFIAYYGGKGNIPRWITVSSFLVGSASLLFAFPYFRVEDSQRNVEIEDICQAVKTVKPCSKAPLSFRSNYMTFFILGQSVQGIAAIPLYVLGVTFIYDSVATHSAGIYLGIVEAVGILGYSLGYTIGAPLIKVFVVSVNSTSEKSVGDSGDKERWRQTWWSYFVIIAVIAWSTLIPFSCFPQSLRAPLMGELDLKCARVMYSPRVHQPAITLVGGGAGDSVDRASQTLIKNPIFVCLSLSRASESLVMMGASEFLPIYIENQFILTPSEATTLAGLVLLPGGALGQILGGIIISKLHISSKGLMKFVIITSAISLVLLAFVVFVYCDPIPFAGITEDYGGAGQLGNLTAPCNSHCKCSSAFYSATCGRNDIAYFSPCFAGCTQSKSFKASKTYYNCSCIKEGLTTADDQGDFIDATSGTCDSKCYKLPLFVAFIFSTIVFSAFADVPGILTILRIMSDKQRHLAMGMTFVILRICGTIPGPIIFKIIRETSCIFRDTERCGSTGNCWIYYKTKMAYLLVGVCK